MRSQPIHFFAVFGLIAAMFTLSGCADFATLFDQKKPKAAQHKPVKAQPNVNAEAYVMRLALARLTLANNEEDVDAALGEAQYLKSYHTQKKAKPQTLTLLVIEYKPKGGSSRKIIAPVVNRKPAYSGLRTVLGKMQNLSATLQNIRLVSATVSPDKSFVLPEDAGNLQETLASEQQQLMARAHGLSLIDNIKTQLDLLAFFTNSRYQDAAYLTLDNAKRSIAEATQDKTLDDATVTGFSNKLDVLENRLKKDMPYRL